VKIHRLFLLAAVVGFCLLILSLQTRGEQPRATDVVAFVTTPVQKALAAVQRGAYGVWATYLDWKNVRFENRNLRDEVQRLRVESLVVRETSEENQRLRRLLDLRERLPINTVSGEVIAREWGGWVRSLTVNRGRSDDISRLAAVISPDGLVGRVVDVRAGAAVVQVLTDPASTIGAHALRTRTPGIVEGEPRGTIRFKYMARDGAGLQVGDVVVSSGQSGVFPRGIPIGRVRAIDDRGSALFHYAAITPAVDFSRVDEVLLLTGDRAKDVTAYFATGG
jgi:rod shape-determining protein MreC